MKGKILIFFDFFILGAMRQGVEEKAFSVLWVGWGLGKIKNCQRFLSCFGSFLYKVCVGRAASTGEL